jgi:hypothetical protein
LRLLSVRMSVVVVVVGLCLSDKHWTGFRTRRGETAFLLSKTIRVSSIYVNRLLQTMIDNWHSLPNKKYGIELKNQQLTLKWFKEKENKIVKK